VKLQRHQTDEDFRSHRLERSVHAYKVGLRSTSMQQEPFTPLLKAYSPEEHPHPWNQARRIGPGNFHIRTCSRIVAMKRRQSIFAPLPDRCKDRD